jgi:hypothetical protein
VESSIFGVSLRASNFIYEMIPVILIICPYEWVERLVSNIFRQLGTIKRRIFLSLCRILNRIMTFADISFGNEQYQLEKAVHTRNRIRTFIVDNYQSKIIIYLTVLDFEMKEHIFEMVLRLIECSPTNAALYL